jgi:hypothetical protein
MKGRSTDILWIGRQRGATLLAFLLVWGGVGCRPSDPVPTDSPPAVGQPGAQSGFVLGDLLQPFTPPPLAELEADLQWEARPVLDAMEQLRQEQAAETPTLTPGEALRMRNDSPAANARILSALGRLPEDPPGRGLGRPIVRHTPRRRAQHQPALDEFGRNLTWRA